MGYVKVDFRRMALVLTGVMGVAGALYMAHWGQLGLMLWRF